MTDRTSVIHVTLPGDAPARLDKALAAAVPAELGLSRSRLQALIAGGAVRRAGAVLGDAKTRVAPGDEIVIALPPPVPTAAEAQEIPLDILYEDDGLIVIDKPAGMVVHPAPGSESGTLVNALLHHCGASLAGIGGEGRPGIVHRIDKDTSGVLVVAKTDLVHQGLSAQFADHSAERLYQAVVWGRPDPAEARLAGLPGVSFEPDGVIRVDAPIGRHRADRKKMAVRRDGGGRRAVTRLRVEEGFGPDGRGAALVRCWLETGRTHQVRVHAAHLGHPLVGDPVYGTGRRRPGWAAEGPVAAAIDALRGQALHAAVLGFVHPLTGASMRFEAPPPEAFNRLLATLRQASR